MLEVSPEIIGVFPDEICEGSVGAVRLVHANCPLKGFASTEAFFLVFLLKAGLLKIPDSIGCSR